MFRTRSLRPIYLTKRKNPSCVSRPSLVYHYDYATLYDPCRRSVTQTATLTVRAKLLISLIDLDILETFDLFENARSRFVTDH